MEPESTRVALQHRQGLLREGLALVLDAQERLALVGAVAGTAALVELCDTKRPDAVVLEVGGTQWDPCVVAARVRRRNRSVRVLGLHRGIGGAEQRRALDGGLDGLVDAEAGLVAVLAALNGGVLQPTVIDLRAGSDLFAGHPAGVDLDAAIESVTERECEVLAGVSGGRTTAEIAERLGISPKTVENHKQRLFAKLGVRNQAHAVSVALRGGLLGRADRERTASDV